MLKPFLTKLMNQEHLSEVEIKLFMDSILTIDNPVQIAAALALLHAKGETIVEISTLLQIIKNSMLAVETNTAVLDIVGTGGDGSHTFNISTAACFLVAACGVNVVKHGNRAVSSTCGAADILESFGVDLHIAKENISNTLDKFNFAFCFAPLFHPTLKKFSDIRRRLETPTFFNLLGPLLNPASPQFLILGVKNIELVDRYTSLIKTLNIKRALIVHNYGMDEISCVGVNTITEINDGNVSCFEVDPQQYGLQICSLESLQAFSIEQSRQKFETALTKVNSPEAQTIILNAALALYVTGKCESILAGVSLAKEKVEKGDVIALFRDYIKHCAVMPGLDPGISKRPEEITGSSPVMTELQNPRTISSSINFLEKILDQKQQEITLLKQRYGSQKSFKSVLKKDHLTVIAEIKRHSPAKGFLSAIPDPIKQADKYIEGGADAISILTDEKFFQGNKAEFLDLSQHYQNHDVCFLQKDFILDRIQIIEAACLGANAVLLIAKILKEKLSDLIQFAKSLNLDALVEIHSLDELQLALDAGAEIIGVNNRDLTTFQTDWRHSLSLIDKIPSTVIKVSESAIDSVEKAQILRQAGFDAVLIGEALVKADQPEVFIKQCRLD